MEGSQPKGYMGAGSAATDKMKDGYTGITGQKGLLVQEKDFTRTNYARRTFAVFARQTRTYPKSNPER